MWNESILRISKNPALERIVLGERSLSPNTGLGSSPVAGLGSGSMNHNWPMFQHHQPQQRQSVAEYREGEGEKGILGTGLFFTEAKKHSRLCELIKAGTYVFSYFLLLFSSFLISYFYLCFFSFLLLHLAAIYYLPKILK